MVGTRNQSTSDKKATRIQSLSDHQMMMIFNRPGQKSLGHLTTQSRITRRAYRIVRFVEAQGASLWVAASHLGSCCNYTV